MRRRWELNAAQFNHPYGLSWLDNSLYVADSYDHRIRKITTTGGVHFPLTVSTVAGTGDDGDAGDGGAASAANLHIPEGVYAADTSHIYVADTGNNRVRLVVDGGTISTFAGHAGGGGWTETAAPRPPRR